MAPPIGFVIVTHSNPNQLVRLTSRLADLFGEEAPIVVHHDFGQCDFDSSILPRRVRLVRPHLTTGWDCWNWIDAVLAGLRLLHADGGPDYSVVLSGSDYPVAAPDRVIADLQGAGADAYMHAVRVTPWRRQTTATGDLGLGVNEGADHQELCYRRYFSTTFRPFGLRVRLRNPLVAPLLTPFSRRFGCWAGEPWWTLGRRGVAALLEAREARPDLVRWFAERTIPEEAYVHTVLCNAPGLKLDPRSFRYVDWNSRTPHPRELGPADLPRIAASGAHFARKFAPGAAVLDALDASLGLEPWVHRTA